MQLKVKNESNNQSLPSNCVQVYRKKSYELNFIPLLCKGLMIALYPMVESLDW